MNSKNLSNIGMVFFSALIVIGLFAHFNIVGAVSRSLGAGGPPRLGGGVKPQSVPSGYEENSLAYTYYWYSGLEDWQPISNPPMVVPKGSTVWLRIEWNGAVGRSLPPHIEANLRRPGSPMYDVPMTIGGGSRESVRVYSPNLDKTGVWGAKASLYNDSGGLVDTAKVYSLLKVPSEKKEYRLTVSVSGRGTVHPKPSRDKYPEGAEVELYARPSKGWEFDHWDGDVVNPDSKATAIIMDSDKSVVAVFKKTPEEYYLAVSKEGQGTVRVEQHAPIRPTGERYGPYPKGSSITLTAKPADGWRFARWAGDISGTARRQSFTLTSNTEVTAIFSKRKRTVELAYDTKPKTAGHIETRLLKGGGGVKPTAVEEYPYGSLVQLTAKAEEGFVFDHWAMNGRTYSASSRITITLRQNTTMRAYFAEIKPIKATLSVDIKGKGTVNRVNPEALDADEQFTVDKGETIGLRAIPDEGYKFAGWSGARSTDDKTISVLMDSDKTITARFKEKKPITEKSSLLATIFGSIGFIGSALIRFF